MQRYGLWNTERRKKKMTNKILASLSLLMFIITFISLMYVRKTITTNEMLLGIVVMYFLLKSYDEAMR